MADTWDNSDDSGSGGLDRSGGEVDTTDYSNDPDYGSYGPRGPITNSGQNSGYTPPDNYSGYRGGAGGGDGPMGGGGGVPSAGGGGASPTVGGSPYTVGGGMPTPAQPANAPQTGSGAPPTGGSYGGGFVVPTINIPQSSSPFFSNVTGSMTLNQNTVGMPSILLSSTGSPQLPSAPGPIRSDVVPPVGTPQYNFTPNYGVPAFQQTQSPYKLDKLSETSPQQDLLRSQAIQNTEAANRLAGQQRAFRSTIDAYLGKNAAVESSFGKNLQSSTSSASGIFQFTDGTWLSTFKNTFPDLFKSLGGDTAQGKSAILSMKNGDPALQTEMARSLTMDNASALSRNQLPVTEGNLYLSHFLGSTGAINVLNADDNTPAAVVVSPAALEANKFLRDMSVGQLKSWANDKMSSVDSDTARSYIASVSGGGGGIPSVVSSYTEADRPAIGGSPAYFGPNMKGAGFSIPGEESPQKAAAAAPDSFGTWLDKTFGTSKQAASLEDQGKTVLFPDAASKESLVDEDGNPISVKEWYRQDMENQLGRPVNIDEVKSRIVGSGPDQRIDYYVKGLDQAFGEAALAPFKAIGNLFPSSDSKNVPPPNVTPAQAASTNPSSFGAWLDGLLNPTERIQSMEQQGRTSIFAGTPETWSPDQIEALTDPETGELMSPKQWYANQFADGDISKVRTRINSEGKVDYYVKGLDEAIGEGLMAPFKAIGNMFGGSTAAPEDTGIKSLGAGGDKNNPDNLRPPADVPEKQAAADPTYTTGMDLTRRVYSGNPLVPFSYPT